MTWLRVWAAAMLITSTWTGAGAAQGPAMETAPVPGIMPSGFGEAVDRDVAKIRAATDRFKATTAAEGAGYQRVTECIEHQPAGAMGYHWQNNGILDTTLDVDHPEVLVYEKNADGSFKLNGVEFLVPISAWKSTEPPRTWGQPSSAPTASGSDTSMSGRGRRVRVDCCGLESAREMRNRLTPLANCGPSRAV
jgi:hypothetical protein